jgi:hypothetical protein
VVVITPEKQEDSAEQDQMDRDFEKLVTDLRGALEAKSGKSKVWLPEAERKDFRIMLVDKVSYDGLASQTVEPSRILKLNSLFGSLLEKLHRRRHLLVLPTKHPKPYTPRCPP